MSLSVFNVLKRTFIQSISVRSRCLHGLTGHEKCSDPNSRGLVLGVYSDEKDRLDHGVLTPIGRKYNETSTNGRLLELLRIAGPMPRRGETRILFDVEPNYSAIAVCGLGKECLGYDSYEQLDEGKEAIRTASAAGVRALQALDTNKIYVESFGHAESAAEGAGLGSWVYQELKSKQDKLYIPQIDMHIERGMDCDIDGWKIGIEKAAAQNFARQLQETPANLMSPTLFAKNVVQVLCSSGVNVEVKVRDWAERQKMDPFLAISKGSCEPPIFLELSYYGTNHDEQPIVLIGQGNTFDSGGICAKKYGELLNSRGEMSGAACVVATCRAIANLHLPINIRALIPLCEHMIGCNAVKPGDVVQAKNGKSIEVTDTDNESVLVLLDALLYAQDFWPKYIIDIGNMSHDLRSLLGRACTGVYTNSDDLWNILLNASIHTGDRVWRMPLWDYFAKQMATSMVADLTNVGSGRGGGSCKSAGFLREFVPCGQWMHLDTVGVMATNRHDFNYLRDGMSGRPTRTLIECIAQMVCKGGKAK